MKKLPPSMREKEHYLVLSVNEQTDNKEKIKQEIEKAILEYIGSLGYSKANPKFIEFAKNKKVIISVNRKYVRHVKAALTLREIKCVGVSGILKRAREKFMDK